MSNIILIENEEHFNKIITENQNVVVDFFAEWCRPCKNFLPVLAQVSQEIEGVVFCKVNVETLVSVATNNNVRQIPTIIYFKDGQKIESKVGAMSKAEFISMLKKNYAI